MPRSESVRLSGASNGNQQRVERLNMSTLPDPHVNQSPAVTVLGNAVYAIFVCTAIHLLCGWGIDWVNNSVGNPTQHKAPTWTGTILVASQTGWPVLVLAVLCGLFGRNLNGLTATLILTHFLGLIDTTVALMVGIVLVLMQQSDID